jgi:hypothetical protein
MSSIQAKIAERASDLVRKVLRSNTSHSRLAKKLSAIALSKQSPTLPIDGRTPSLVQRVPKAIAVYSGARTTTFLRGALTQRWLQPVHFQGNRSQIPQHPGLGIPLLAVGDEKNESGLRAP